MSFRLHSLIYTQTFRSWDILRSTFRSLRGSGSSVRTAERNSSATATSRLTWRSAPGWSRRTPARDASQSLTTRLTTRTTWPRFTTLVAITSVRSATSSWGGPGTSRSTCWPTARESRTSAIFVANGSGRNRTWRWEWERWWGECRFYCSQVHKEAHYKNSPVKNPLEDERKLIVDNENFNEEIDESAIEEMDDIDSLNNTTEVPDEEGRRFTIAQDNFIEDSPLAMARVIWRQKTA